MKHAAPIRRELGVPTIFNILGPLTNPARPVAGLIGCASERMAPAMAQVFADRGDRVFVVRGENGWHEISPYGVTQVWDTTRGGVLMDPSSGIRGRKVPGISRRRGAWSCGRSQ